MKIVKHLLVYILVLLLSFFITLTRWGLAQFGNVNFDEILFQLRTPILSTEENILKVFFYNALVPAIITSIIVFIVIVFIYKFLTKKKKFTLRKIFIIILIIISICIPIVCLNKFDFFQYLEVQMTNSKFIEKNYVDPSDVEIKFPKEKKNLIFLYLESYESSFLSKDLGGVKNTNLLEPMTKITKENVNFSDTKKIGGARGVYGTSWTSAAIMSMSCGIPLKLRISYKTMEDNAIGIGDILEKEGYNQEWMMGSDARFGNRESFIRRHGNFKIEDYYTLKDEGKIDKDYKEWWGVEDKTLLKLAKNELKQLSSKDKPFNFTLLTSNTHVQDGYTDKSCKKKYKDPYSNSVYCNAEEVNEFLRWVQKQDFYKDTVIVISGDHLTMQNHYFKKKDKRRIYNLIINGPDTKRNTDKEFSTLDMFPTTLAALGVEIEGNRLALGTNLYSNEKTLMEKYGYKKFDKELSYRSKYYLDTFRGVR
ncbi:MAG: LTA synthase family protein [Bacilli bacterium]|nr:LTA synthase family protein [Bacilli bacterium]